MKLSTIKKKLKGFQNIKSMQSPSRSGGAVANQFIITFDNATVFQSYSSVIAIEMNNRTYLTDKWDYSVTTGKYRNQFLNENKKETQEKINNKEYIILE
jgi:hypothetical protein